MALTIASLDTPVISDNGGDLVQLTGTFDAAVTTTVSILGVDGDEILCYLGVTGYSTSIVLTAAATQLTFVAPPLPRGGPYAIIVRQGATDASIQELNVANRSFSSAEYALRRANWGFAASGSLRLEDTPPLADADIVPPLRVIQWPVAPQFLVDADQPGAGNLPKDVGAQSLGTFAVASGSPTYVAPVGSTPGYWRFVYTNPDRFELNALGVDITPPFTVCMLFMHETGNTQIIMDGFSFVGVPYCRTVYPPQQVRVNNITSVTTGTALDFWEAQVFTIGPGPNFEVNNYALRNNVGPVTLATSSISRCDLNGLMRMGDHAGDYFGGKISAVAAMPGIVTPASIRAAILDRYAGLFG